ncbi:hypothetical protein GCM10025868_38920 [Angustibacter aerolatus]|uniref:Uncharacterized protein n=1 Tax=Angustibacter aerolatus TaxID=1162965 RepID=A0ABQ6JLJ2_9ACTN|nr:hypothetical protein GCM10025868_38920 [Angustibacter aerolatus]
MTSEPDASRPFDFATRPSAPWKQAEYPAAKSLLGVGAGARAAHLLRRGEVEVEHAVLAGGVAGATAGGRGAGGVDDLRRGVGHAWCNRVHRTLFPAGGVTQVAGR